jgi:Fe-S cluster biogenesis protein NfuA
MTLRQAVEDTLADLLPVTSTDGYRLHVHEVSGNRVVLALGLHGGQCDECVLPTPSLRRIVAAALAERGEAGVEVFILDERERAD